MKSNAKSAWGTFDVSIILAMMLSLFVYCAAGQTLGAICPGWSVTNDVRMAIDLNRDGKADLAAFDNSDNYNHSALWTAINNGDGTFSVQKALPDLDAANAGDPTKHIRMLVDLNGDHIPDIVIFGDAGVWTSLSQQNPIVAPPVSAVERTVPHGGASPFEPPTVFGTPNLVLPNFGVAQGWDPSKHLRIVADVNHDGYPDIIGFGDDGIWVSLGKGDGTFGTPQPALANQNFGVQQGWSVTNDVRLLADLKNDGFLDIVGFGYQGVWTAMNKRDGTGTFADPNLVLPNFFGSQQGWTPAKHVRLTAVLNNVGLADIIAFGDQGVWTALGNGDGTFQTPKLVLANFGVAQGWDPAKHVRLMADLNNDGRDDIVAFGDAGVWTALSVGKGTFAPPKLAAAVTAPLGHTPPPFEPGAGTFETPNLVLENFGVKQEWSPAKHIRVMADINGDHYPDIVAFGDGGVWTALGKGDGTFQTPQFPLDYFACNGKFDFNLEWTQTDPNGFPLNPQWRWQLYNPPTVPPDATIDTPSAAMCHYFTKQISYLGGSVPVPSFSDCTDQTNINNVNLPGGTGAAVAIERAAEAVALGTSGSELATLAAAAAAALVEGVNASVCSVGAGSGFPGHLNWFTSTFQASHSADPEYGLTWGDHNIDDDYDMPLIAPGAPAIMNDRHDLHTEFDASETMKYFHTPWWNNFRAAVDSGGWGSVVISPGGEPLALEMLLDADAIMTGISGVDCEHDGCKSELHPVFTLAAHVQDNPDNDVWAMFLRNTGDEGYCSSSMEHADFTNYTFRLPWRTEESVPWNSVEVLWGPNKPDCTTLEESQAKSCFEGWPGSTGPEVTYLVGQWVDVSFGLGLWSNKPHPLIDGELHLQWSRKPIPNAPLTSGPAAPSPSAPNSPAPSSHVIQEEPDEAGVLRTAMDRLSPAQQSQIRKAVAAATASAATLQVLPAGKPAREVTASEAPAPHPAVRIGEQGPAATEKAARDAAMIRELCKAYGGSIKGAPANMCAQASH